MQVSSGSCDLLKKWIDDMTTQCESDKDAKELTAELTKRYESIC